MKGKGNEIHEPFTPSELRKKAKIMRQFLKSDGPVEVTDAYREGWERVFGIKVESILPGRNATKEELERISPSPRIEDEY